MNRLNRYSFLAQTFYNGYSNQVRLFKPGVGVLGCLLSISAPSHVHHRFAAI